MEQARARADPRTGVVAGARARALPRLIAHLLAAFVAVAALLIGLGLLVTRALDGTGLHREEVELVRAVQGTRTPTWDAVTTWGTVLGSTGVVVAVTAAGCLLLLRRGHGPRLPAFLALAVAGETGLFLLAALVIDRERPPIEQLDTAPPTSSFPSGHTAATLALACGLALGLARTRQGRRLIAVIWAVGLAFAAFVMVTRLYRGMHWPTDLAASVVFVVAWLFLLRAILLPPGVRDRPAHPALRGDAGDPPAPTP